MRSLIRRIPTQFHVVSVLFALTYAGKEEVQRHLDLGKEFLAKGQFADALSHYHAAIDLDPLNYQTLYRRATVYLAMGKSKSAVPDLDKVIELKGDFIALAVEPRNAEVAAKAELIADLRQYLHQAKSFFERADYHSAEYYLNKAVEHLVWDPSLYRLRAKCLESRGEVRKAIADMRTLTKLVADSTEDYLRISQLYYGIGDVEESLTQVRECLKLNPDHKECFPLYKKVKKIVKMRESLNDAKSREDWMGCLEKGQQILKAETKVTEVQMDVYRHLCKCNTELGHTNEAIQQCTDVLENSDPNDVDVLCDRAEAYLLDERYDEAIEDFQKAQQINGESRRAQEGLEKAQKLKKQAGKRDYYKILGLKRNASKRDVTKAYRKLAQKWHPDNFNDEKEKKKAEAKFIDIAAAKEVLSDDEKRAQFDQGIDPLDPDSKTGGTHFHHGFPVIFMFREGGGPFSFKFNF
ncbi:tetratricopeptide repeat protein [Ostertagia ostertagi]